MSARKFGRARSPSMHAVSISHNCGTQPSLRTRRRPLGVHSPALSARGFALHIHKVHESPSPRALAKGHRRSHSKSRYELGESTEERPASELGLGGMWEVSGLQCPVRSGLGCVLCCLRSGPIPIRRVGWISPTCSPFPAYLFGLFYTERRNLWLKSRRRFGRSQAGGTRD